MLPECESFSSNYPISPPQPDLPKDYRSVVRYPKHLRAMEFRIQIERYMLILGREYVAYTLYHNIPTGACGNIL